MQKGGVLRGGWGISNILSSPNCVRAYGRRDARSRRWWEWPGRKGRREVNLNVKTMQMN